MEISLFTTNFSIHLLSLTNLVNNPSTLISSMQLVQHSIRTFDPSGDTLNIHELFLTSNFSTYSVKLSSSLGSSDHRLISVYCPITPVPHQNPWKRRCFWHYISAKWDDLRRYYSDFPRNDYCFSIRDLSISLCRTHSGNYCLWHGSVHPTYLIFFHINRWCQ